MVKTQYFVAASVDGFIADRDGGLEWLLQFGFEEFQGDYDAFLAEVGVIVMGSATYEFLLAEGGAWAYPEHPAWVLTSRPLPKAEGGELHFAHGDVAGLHRAWIEAAGGRNIWIVGGGVVAAQVADAGLLDEIVLTTMPVVLGAGAQLLPLGGTTGVLAATGTHVHPSGAITTTYALPRP